MELIKDETYSRIQNAILASEDYSAYLKEFGMELDARALNIKAKKLKHFGTRIVFLGPWNSGKSTVINALIGKNIVQTGLSKGTAVINLIKAGADPDNVNVYFHKQTELDCISKDSFDDKYCRDMQQTERILNGDINAQQHQNIEYAEISCDSNFFDCGIQFVDTPCWEDKLATRKVEKEYLADADAIVVVLKGTSGLSKAEREFIRTHFANKQLKNLYVLITYADVLAANNALEIVAKHYRDELRNVFIDEQGNFDEKLFNSRMFFVDAFTALCARTGTFKSTYKDGKWVETPVDKIEDQITGIPEFEAALCDYLNSEAYISGKLEDLFLSMVRTYSAAEKRNAETVQILQKSLSERYCYIYNTLDSINKKRHLVYNTDHEIKTICREIEYRIEDSWRTFITRDLMSHWLNESNPVQNLLHFYENLPATAILLNPQVRHTLIESTGVFFHESLNSWKHSVAQLIVNEVNQLRGRLEKPQFDLDRQLEEICQMAKNAIAHYWEEMPDLFAIQLRENNLFYVFDDRLRQICVSNLIREKVENERNAWFSKKMAMLDAEREYYETFTNKFDSVLEPKKELNRQNRVLAELFACLDSVNSYCSNQSPSIEELYKFV